MLSPTLDVFSREFEVLSPDNFFFNLIYYAVHIHFFVPWTPYFYRKNRLEQLLCLFFHILRISRWTKELYQRTREVTDRHSFPFFSFFLLRPSNLVVLVCYTVTQVEQKKKREREERWDLYQGQLSIFCRLPNAKCRPLPACLLRYLPIQWNRLLLLCQPRAKEIPDFKDLRGMSKWMHFSKFHIPKIVPVFCFSPMFWTLIPSIFHFNLSSPFRSLPFLVFSLPLISSVWVCQKIFPFSLFPRFLDFFFSSSWHFFWSYCYSWLSWENAERERRKNASSSS